ncbi:MAG: LptF/LptG family permease [Deltaproteobacteria bacterium]|nr:LptF/LptG family permease [Deltaproteobacteria bacterium]
MLKILDRYILREYMRLFLLCLAFFAALVIVVMLLDKEISRLLAKDRTIIEAIKVILYKAPGLIMRVPCVPAGASLAAFFMLSRFVRNNELAAMKSAGVSMYRIIFLLSAATVVICILAGIFNDRIVASANWRARVLEGRNRYHLIRNVIFKGKNNHMYYIQNVNLKTQTLINLTVYEFNTRDELTSETHAPLGIWSGNTWTLKDCVSRTFAEGKEIESSSLDVKRITVDEDPILFTDKKPVEMTYATLSKLVKYKKEAGRVFRGELVEMHHKIAYPFAALVVILITVPLAVQYGRAGIAAGFLITMFISFMYWGIAIAIFEALGVNGVLPPAVACWASNVLFGAVGGVLIWKVDK